MSCTSIQSFRTEKGSWVSILYPSGTAARSPTSLSACTSLIIVLPVPQIFLPSSGKRLHRFHRNPLLVRPTMRDFAVDFLDIKAPLSSTVLYMYCEVTAGMLFLAISTITTNSHWSVLSNWYLPFPCTITLDKSSYCCQCRRAPLMHDLGDLFG